MGLPTWGEQDHGHCAAGSPAKSAPRHVVTPQPIVIEVLELRKSYGARVALDSVSLDLRAGEVIGLLGPNGAGKTTTLSILATLMAPDAGTVKILGFDAHIERAAIRRRLGFVPQSIALYPSLTATENLQLFLRMHGLSRAAARDACESALAVVDLAQRANDPVSILSGGMQRRLNLACGIAHHPQILLLDEPAVGVDPKSRDQILRTVRGLADDGAAAIYSTHYMEEVERLCDQVLLLDRGKIIAAGSIPEVIAMADSRLRVEFTFASRPPAYWYEGIDAQEMPSPASAPGRITLALANVNAVAELLLRARTVNGGPKAFNVRSPNLADAFTTLTGHSLREGEPN
jgi:ABC-2 type transport system ATP-binding protein